MITPLETHITTQDGHDDSIRQIAILLHALPQRTHRVLLGQLGTEDKQSIADEMSAMGEIDAMEQVHVLKRMRDDLQTETSRVEKVESEIQDEIQIGRARVSKKRSKPIYRNTDSVAETSAESHPGSAHLPTPPPGSASRDDASADLPHQHSEHQHSEHQHSEHQPQADVVTGEAAIPPTNEVLQSMFAQFHQTQAAGVLPSALLQHGTSHQREHQADTSGESPRLLPIHETPIREAHRREAPTPEAPTPEAPCNAAELAERVDRFLTKLPTQDLCRALGMVSTKQAFLVLCGLPNETAETVLEMLPRRQSRKVRSDMRRMGQLQLSDIDAAKQIVAQIAIRFTQPATSFAA